MTNIITILLAVAVAVLAAVCLRLSHAIKFKNKVLVRFLDENMKLKDEVRRLNDVIEDKDFQLLDNDELIQNLNNKLRDGGRMGSNDPTTKVFYQ